MGCTIFLPTRSLYSNIFISILCFAFKQFAILPDANATPHPNQPKAQLCILSIAAEAKLYIPKSTSEAKLYSSNTTSKAISYIASVYVFTLLFLVESIPKRLNRVELWLRSRFGKKHRGTIGSFRSQTPIVVKKVCITQRTCMTRPYVPAVFICKSSTTEPALMMHEVSQCS